VKLGAPWWRLALAAVVALMAACMVLAEFAAVAALVKEVVR
jgi:hypothetical protein